MRLLTKTTLYFFAAMVLLLLVTGLYLYRQFSKQLNERSDQELMADEAGWIDYLQSGVDNGAVFNLRTKDLAIYPVNDPPGDYPEIEDVNGRNQKTNRLIPYRQLSQVVDISGVRYQIILKKSQEQKTALIIGFTRVILFVLAALFLVTILFNWLINRKLWIPFRRSLQKIQTAELDRMQAIHFEKTNTTEFNELNTALNYMTDKIARDFINMKEFTENAAHEMQTPIAVVQSKLELLLQDTNLHDDQLQSVAEASAVLNRLGRLNQGLLLLAKIENNQYETTEKVGLAEVTKKYLQLFSELIKNKQLKITTDFKDAFTIAVHPLLADSLITNLLGNAIKYNYTGGSITISSNADSYLISNSSHLPGIPADKLFRRFNTIQTEGEWGNGLGLSIVKKIADANGLLLIYAAENGDHEFIIRRR